jgi:hypothetical protein
MRTLQLGACRLGRNGLIRLAALCPGLTQLDVRACTAAHGGTAGRSLKLFATAMLLEGAGYSGYERRGQPCPEQLDTTSEEANVASTQTLRFRRLRQLRTSFDAALLPPALEFASN